MIKIVAFMYLTAIVTYAFADKGIKLAGIMLVFVGLPMLMGYLIDKDKEWWK